jgi:hypothetical protein
VSFRRIVQPANEDCDVDQNSSEVECLRRLSALAAELQAEEARVDADTAVDGREIRTVDRAPPNRLP